jgi:2-dehydro-3-deoxyglucarate aldolase
MKPSIGTWITIPHISIIEILSNANFDWMAIDMEHTSIDYGEAQKLILAIQSKGIKAYVRVGENNPRIIKRVLDAGADGIIVPAVNTKEDAIKAVKAVYYPPFGERGVGLSRAQNYGFGFDTYLDRINRKEIRLIVQIEHYLAIENLDQILSQEGINGVFLGPYDLSASIGKPGGFTDPDVNKLLESYERITKVYPHKWKGVHVIQPDAELLNHKLQEGYNFIAFSLDFFFLGIKAFEEMKKIKHNP